MVKSEDPGPSGASDSGEEYETVLRLEELESLLEELEEYEGQGSLPADLRDEMSSFGVAGVEELRARIRSLHEKLDTQEGR